MTDLPRTEKRRLRAYFGFARMPFSKYAWAAQMYDSTAQRELLHALEMWIEVGSLAVLIGLAGVGKSITLRRFIQGLDEARYRVVHFSYLATTVTGFLRSLNRLLGLPMRLHTADLFDQAHKLLAGHEQERGAHPLLVIDDAEGLSLPVLDTLRRLIASEVDGETHASLLLSGTDDLLGVLRHPTLDPVRSRVAFAQQLRPFGLEDTRHYVRYHLERAEADPQLFSDDAIQRIFQASHGRPRSINQLATQALIQAAVLGRTAIDGDFMASLIAAHPLYQTPPGGAR